MQVKTIITGVSVIIWLLFGTSAFGAGLGKISVYSKLGQPFNADIELIVPDASELPHLHARLGSVAAFDAAHLEVTAALESIHFNIQSNSNGQMVVHLSSDRAVTDPFLDMLVTLDWNNGQLMREYTVLLDPVGMNMDEQAVPAVVVNNASAPATPTIPAPVQTSSSVPTSSPATTTALTSMPAVMSAPASTPTSDNSSTHSQDQAVSQVQPIASVKHKLARLPEKKHVMIQPKAAAVSTSVPPVTQTAITIKHGMVLSAIAHAHQSQGVQLDQMLVGLYRQNPDAFDGNMNRLIVGKVLHIPTHETLAAISGTEASQEVSLQAQDWNSYRQKLAGEATRMHAVPQGNQQASGKIIAAVQKPPIAVNPVLGVLKLSHGNAATVQSAGGTNAQAMAQKQMNQDDAAAKKLALNEAKIRAALLEKNAQDLKKLAALQLQARQLAAQQAMKSNVPSQVQPLVKAVVPLPKPVQVLTPPKPVSVVSTPPQRKWFEVMDNAPLLLAGLGVVGLVWLLTLVKGKRKLRADRANFEQLMHQANPSQFNAVHQNNGGASVNTQQTFATQFGHSGLETLDTHDVDPIAEAEVYIAYGRDHQAEEILKTALQSTPDRHEIKSKLLEIYANRRAVPEFETLASALQHDLEPNSDEWGHVAELGRQIDPQNPLYAQVMRQNEITQGSGNTKMGWNTALYGHANRDGAAFDLELDLSTGLQLPEELMFHPDFDSPAPPSIEATATEDVAPYDDVQIEQGVTDMPPVSTEQGVLEMPVAHDDVQLTEHNTQHQAIVVASEEIGMAFDMEETLDLDVAAVPEIKNLQPAPLDFSGIDFNFDEAAPVKVTGVSEFTQPESIEEHVFDLAANTEPVVEQESMDSAEQAVQTKLDLARVYAELGDIENAHAIVQEVLSEGSAKQQEAAQALLQDLGHANS